MKKVTLRAGTGSSRATTLSVDAAHGEAVLADRERSRVKGARDRLSKKSADRKGLRSSVFSAQRTCGETRLSRLPLEKW